MADDADIAQRDEERYEALRLAQYKGYQIPEGKAGECDLCGEDFSRLVNGACVACRTKYRLE